MDDYSEFDRQVLKKHPPIPHAEDHMGFEHPTTGDKFYPVWKHRDCGGTVYRAYSGLFKCDTCAATSMNVAFDSPYQIGEEEAHVRHLYTQVNEVWFNTSRVDQQEPG